jgi:predicted transcriptional regulator
MASVREDLANFHEFVVGRLASNVPAVSLDELFIEWYDLRHGDEINAAIRRGLADVDAGRYVPMDDAAESIRREFGFSKE